MTDKMKKETKNDKIVTEERDYKIEANLLNMSTYTNQRKLKIRIEERDKE